MNILINSVNLRISDNEWIILKIFWLHGTMSASNVFRYIPKDHAWAYKTVKTMLTRLVRKNILCYRQIGNRYHYSIDYTCQEVLNAATTSFVNSVYDGDFASFWRDFVYNVPRRDLEKLREKLMVR